MIPVHSTGNGFLNSTYFLPSSHLIGNCDISPLPVLACILSLMAMLTCYLEISFPAVKHSIFEVSYSCTLICCSVCLQVSFRNTGLWLNILLLHFLNYRMIPVLECPPTLQISTSFTMVLMLLINNFLHLSLDIFSLTGHEHFALSLFLQHRLQTCWYYYCLKVPISTYCLAPLIRSRITCCS